MKKQSLIKKIAVMMGISLFCNIATPVSAGSALFGEYPEGEILSFGCSLTKAQEQQLRKYFNVSDSVDAIYVTTEVAVKQLGLDEEKSKSYKGGWYSSAYVKLTHGTGINVTSNNLTLVTDDMLANALITSGILNADVIATSPIKVTGQSALAGILAGAEEIMGEELSQENKETAQKEIETTMDVAEEIGQKEASAIINEIKAEVIKDSPINVTQIENIVINVTNNYGVELSDNTRAKVVSTMSAINDLDIDYKDVKSTLKDVSDKLFKDLQEVVNNGENIGIKIKDTGFFTKIGDWIKYLVDNLIGSLKDFLKNNTTNESINDDENNPIIENKIEENIEENVEVNDGLNEVNENINDTIIEEDFSELENIDDNTNSSIIDNLEEEVDNTENDIINDENINPKENTNN